MNKIEVKILNEDAITDGERMMGAAYPAWPQYQEHGRLHVAV